MRTFEEAKALETLFSSKTQECLQVCELMLTPLRLELNCVKQERLSAGLSLEEVVNYALSKADKELDKETNLLTTQ